MLKKLLPAAAILAAFGSISAFTWQTSSRSLLSGADIFSFFLPGDSLSSDSLSLSVSDSISGSVSDSLPRDSSSWDSVNNSWLRIQPYVADSVLSDSLSVSNPDSLKADITAAVDSLLLSASELDSLSRLEEDYYIDTIITATPRVIPPRPNEWTLKTNLLMDFTASPYLGFSFGVGNHWTLEFEGSYNPFSFSGGRKWKHGMGMLGARYWTKDREGGHFVGVHALGGVYNINKTYFGFMPIDKTGDSRYEGWGVGGGLSYGYRWNFTEYWGVEGELGVGYVHSRYDRYGCSNCGERLSTGNHGYLGPTKMALNLIYRFGAKKRTIWKKAIAPRPVPFIRERLVRDTIIQTEIQRDTLTRTLTDTLVQVKRDTVEIEAPVPVVSNKDYTLHIEYKSGSSMLVHSLGNNAKEMEQFTAVLDSMRSNKDITFNSIQVIGYASIDGATATNQRLSSARASGVAQYLRSKYPDLKDVITSEGRGEDWDGLLKLIEESIGLEGKEEASYILRTESTETAKESKLRRLQGGRFYQTIYQDLFPKLRRIECKIGYTEVKMQKTKTVR